MTDTTYWIHYRKLMTNLLLRRKQMVIEVLHPGKANIAKEELATTIAKKFKSQKECIVLYGFKTQFGGGKSKGFCLIYDNENIRKKYDSIPHLRKIGERQKPPMTRKQRKDIKIRKKKVTGTEKTKVVAGGKKKDKKKK